MDSRTIVTLKWGSLYTADYVNRLCSAVRRHLSGDFRFVCFTDDSEGIDPFVECFEIPEIDVPSPQIKGGWRKLCLFHDNLPLSGSCLFMDLDVVITGPLDRFFEYEPDRIPIIHNWVNRLKTINGKRPAVGNSSVFRFPANQCGHIIEQYAAEKEWALSTFHPPQTYLTHCIRDRMVYWPNDWVCSFKRHCRPVFPLNFIVPPRLPQSVSIVVFHGKPNPDEVIHGYRKGKIHHFVHPAPWVAQHWC